MKLIEILPNVYGVKVPMDADDFETTRSQDNYENRMIHFQVPHDVYVWQGESIEIGDFDFKILGTLTKDEISFDASDVVDSTEIDIEQYDGIFVATPRFWDYELESFDFSSSDESFRSALPKDIYFENEYGNNEPNLEAECCGKWQDDGFGNPTCCGNSIPTEESHYLQYLWQTAQENITEKLLILQKL